MVQDPRPRSAGLKWAGLLSANLTHISKRMKKPLHTIQDLLDLQVANLREMCVLSCGVVRRILV